MRPSFKSLKTCHIPLNLIIWACFSVGDRSWRIFLAQYLFPNMIGMEHAAALDGKLPFPAAHHLGRQFWLFQSDTQILVGTHNSAPHNPPLPLALPSCRSPLFSFIQLPVWSSDWFILICSTHIPPQTWHRQAAATVSSLPLLLVIVFCAQSFVIVDYCWFISENVNPHKEIYVFCV